MIPVHGPRRIPRGSVAAAILIGVLLGFVTQVSPGRAQTTGLGYGVLAVNGSLEGNVSLPLGGTYYLAVATDDASSFVNASVTFNGTLQAEENGSVSGSTFASLPAGDYSVSLRGHGRAALAWDFTNGAAATFPDNATLVAFLRPAAGPRIHVNVALGDAQSLTLRLYDDRLLPAGNATVATSETVDFLLPTTHASFAVLTATVTAGISVGLYGLSWSAGPLNPPFDFTAWPWFLLWILVPVGVAFAVFVLLHRRRERRGTGP